jgi:ABC-type transport system involved in multi-copper enzyme maturation permease subunit
LAILASFSPGMQFGRMVDSLKRIGVVGSTELKDVPIPAHGKDVLFPVNFRSDELQEYYIDSDQTIAVNVEKGQGFSEPLFLVEAGQTYRWTPSNNLPRSFEGPVGQLWVSNNSDQEAKVSGWFKTDVEMPEVHQLQIAAISVIGLYLIYLLIYFLAPKVSVIAAATAKEAISQPIYLLLMIIGAVALVAYIYIPYNTFGEDVKMLKTSGMTTIKVLAIIVALWTASISVADEIDGKTALTVLSKPVSRRQFILGKFLGIVWPIVLLFIVLGLIFLLTVSYKVVYDARESAKTSPEWQMCYMEVIRIVPGLVLAFMEAVIMAAVSVAVSTRLSMLPNLILCGSIYVLGHLASLIVKSAVGKIVFVRFIGRLIAIVLPVLDHFEIEGAIAGTSVVPNSYLLTALVYSILYCAAAMLLALILFEDRDLA